MQQEASNQIPLAFCSECEATTVTFKALDGEQQLWVHCSRCDAHLGLVGEVEEILAGPELLEALGYEVEEVRPKGGAGGCRTKGGSCGCSKSKSKKSTQTQKGFQA